MKKILFLLLLPAVTMVSCKKPQIINEPPGVAYFPNETGNYWQYERFDSLTNTTDTFFVRITGEINLNNETYHTWEYQYTDDTIDYHVTQRNDTVFMINTQSGMVETTYLLPFEEGLGWTTLNVGYDTSYVSGFQNVVIDYSVYQNVAVIERNIAGFNEYAAEVSRFKPYLGLVSKSLQAMRFTMLQNETWRLIGYNLE